MHARWRAIATRAPAHLVELDFVIRQVVQHDVADIGDVDAFAKRRCGNEHRQMPLAEQVFDTLAFGARQPGIVEADHEGHLRGFLP